MKIERIFLDMDGVLVDFVGGVLKLFGKEDLLETWPPGEYNLGAVLGLSLNKIWRKIDDAPCWWQGLESYAWASNLRDVCLYYDVPVTIATSPSRSPWSASGKVQWIQSFLGKRFRNYIITPDKSLLSRPGAVLIDDSDANCKAFDTVSNGGVAVTFPRPWNRLHDMTGPVAYVQTALRRIGADSA